MFAFHLKFILTYVLIVLCLFTTGKTTLLDVIAGRKTVGLLEHDKNIFVNGVSKDPITFASITGYVEQNDIHNGMATVREALDFSAKLRLPISVTDEVRSAFVDEVMTLVGLSTVQHRMIGDISQPSLSTGQLKLLTIAVELVANPSIIFLDEPTSGLDAKSAYRVMKAIKRIAATGRTIICTIHQPSQEVFFMFDRLLLLRRGGEVVYFDEIGVQGSTLVDYLTRASRNLIPYSPLVSPANWMLDVVGIDATQLVEEHKAEQELKAKEEAEKAAKQPKLKSANSSAGSATAPSVPATAIAPSGNYLPGQPIVNSASVADSSNIAGVDNALQQAFKRKLLQASKSSAKASFIQGQADESAFDNAAPIQFSEVWSNSEEAKQSAISIEKYSTAPADVSSTKIVPLERVGNLTRLSWVVRRAYISHWRSPPVNITRCILMFIIGLFLGIVYYNINVHDYAGMSSLLAAVFLGVSLPSSICSNASLAMFMRQRAVYYREKSVGMYGYLTYTATMSIVEAPYLLIGLLCFLLPFYFMCGLSTDAGLFFQFLFAGYLMCLFFATLEQVWIAGLPSIIAAQALNGLMMSIFFAFGGLYIKASSIPIGWKWFYYIDPIPKAFIATMLTQVNCPDGGIDGGGRIDGCRTIDLPGEGPKQLYAYIANLLEGAHHSYWPMIGYLVLTIGVARLFSIYLFKKVNHIER
jgi:ABC-type multidrug transport system ATPase subunit